MRQPRSAIAIVIGAVAAVLLAGVGWYVGPWSREFRLARANLLQLDAETVRNPQDGLAWYYLGVRLERQGEPEQAAGPYQQAATYLTRDSRGKVALGRIQLGMGEVGQAFQTLKAAVGTDPTSTEARKLLGILYQRRGAYHKAEAEWNAALALAPRDAESWYNRAFCHLQMQQVTQAAAASDRSVSLQPREPRFLRLRASVAAAAGDLTAARDYYERAIRANPQDARAHHDLANFLLSQSRSAEDLPRAEQAVAELSRLRPDYPLLSWHYARIAAFRLNWPEAIRQLEKTLSVTPALDEAYFQLANAYNRTGDRKRANAAMKEYRRRSELTRRMDEIRIRMAINESPDLLFELGRLRREAGLIEQAREAIEQGLRLAPDSPAGKAELARLSKRSVAGSPGP
jgi:tetratricopeptide (TPR) repeat protein